MILSLQKILALFICLTILTSCVSASNWLSGPARSQNSHLDSSNYLTSIRIGVTTKQETFARLGNPTARQSHVINNFAFESWSYVATDTAIAPYQYIPLFGAVAFWRPLRDQTLSAAMSFSSEDQVSGLTISTVNAYGNIRSPENVPNLATLHSFYGMRNPNLPHTPIESIP